MRNFADPSLVYDVFISFKHRATTRLVGQPRWGPASVTGARTGRPSVFAVLVMTTTEMLGDHYHHHHHHRRHRRRGNTKRISRLRISSLASRELFLSSQRRGRGRAFESPLSAACQLGCSLVAVAVARNFPHTPKLGRAALRVSLYLEDEDCDKCKPARALLTPRHSQTAAG